MARSAILCPVRSTTSTWTLDPTTGLITSAQSIDPTDGGNDTITVGNGNDIIIGGSGTNSITAQTGNSIIIGGNGALTFTGGSLSTAETIDPADSSSSTITAGAGQNVILGGSGSNTITAGAGNDIIVGNNGEITYSAPGVLSSVLSTDVVLGVVYGEPVVVEAEAIWKQVLGPDAARLAILNGITVQVGDLPAGMLGATVGDAIYIDSDAAGWGWFIDPTAAGNAEFKATSIAGVLTAIPGSGASGHMDLLSTVLHEMGNAMGFPEDTGQDVTGKVLEPGTRRLPVPESAAGAGVAVPLIDWPAVGNLTQETLAQSDTDGSSWIDGFLNNVGQDGKHHRPNAGLRIRPLSG
jgi:hypothetical protein